MISEAEFRDIHVRFVKEIKKLDKDDKKNVILYTQLHLIISCLEEVELCLIKDDLIILVNEYVSAATINLDCIDVCESIVGQLVYLYNVLKINVI